MRSWIILVITITLLLPPIEIVSSTAQASFHDNTYIMVGGQNGTWFQAGQTPRLYKIFLGNNSVIRLTPVPGEGTVWGGGWNGSQWLISGWGTDPGPSGSNPYLYLYDGQNEVANGSLARYMSESSWHGGDIFAASYNGKYWLLSGMGSDTLVTATYKPGMLQNHMSLAIFDGDNFTDISSLVPLQQDALLYSNAWNGTYWLIGGGFLRNGVLFTFNGTNVVDLTSSIKVAVRSFASVQSIAWNGGYWLIGGVGFLAKYDGHSFTDLTAQLVRTVARRERLRLTVNAIAWDGFSWMIGGGTAIAQIKKRNQDIAWIASYSPSGFDDLSAALPTYISRPRTGSTILTVCHSNNSWIIGGYSDGDAVLLSIKNGSLTDLSYLVTLTMTYVIWVGSNDT